MSQTNTHALAEKIARILEAESRRPDLSSLQESIEKISQRLDKIEERIAPAAPLVRLAEVHPSQKRFAALEALADQYFKSGEKTCTFEPNDRPCDNCSMCSSHGF